MVHRFKMFGKFQTFNNILISLIHKINKAHKITNEEYVFKSI